MTPRQFRIALAAIVAAWLVVRVVYFNGYYTEDAPGYVSDAIWAAVGNYHARDHVNGLNVGTYLPVAIPIRVLGKSEIAIALWPLACSLLGLLSIAGAARVFFGHGCALLAAFLYATYPGDVFFSTVVMPDAVQAGWLTCSLYLLARSSTAAQCTTLGLAAGAAMGVCHLVRANDVQLVPIGLFAAAVLPLPTPGRWYSAVSHGGAYVSGWVSVVMAEGCAYALTTGDLLHRVHVVQRHYGGLDSIARAGLNVDPRTIPFSLFPPAWWWLHGGWGSLNQDQAYHALLFSAAAVLLVCAAGIVIARGRLRRPTTVGLAIASVWLLWPILYHQFGSQSLTQFVPMHRLSRHLVVYAPGAMFAVAGGVRAIADALGAVDAPLFRNAAAVLGTASLLVHLQFNVQAERIAYGAFHQIKDTYVRIRARLPDSTRVVVADPGDLCFLDFWLNPVGAERVAMVPFAAIDRCERIPASVVLTQSNPGWTGNAPVIVETVRRLPCLTQPPSTWQLLYAGYPERVYVTTGDSHVER